MDNQMLLMQGLSLGEAATLNELMTGMNDKDRQQFLALYRSKRREPELILALTLIGFLGIAGIQRFVVGSIGMGILYFLTCGLCFIGTIIDLINYKDMATAYNQKIALETAQMYRVLGGGKVGDADVR